MIKLSAVFFLLFGGMVTAQTDQESGPQTLRYKSAIINGVKQINEFKSAVAQVKSLSDEYMQLKFSAKPEEAKVRDAREKLRNAQEFVLKKYGMYPDIPYLATPEKATVSLLLTDEQLARLAKEKSQKLADATADNNKTRYPLLQLDSAADINTFVSDTRKGELIRKKIAALKDSRQEQSVEQQKNSNADLKALEDQLNKYNEAMKKTYNIHANLDYVLDTTTITVYMLISSADLVELGAKNRARAESEYKKKLTVNQ